ncbi:MAG: hypothetical protein Q8L82_05760 [Nitrosomonas sp.]|nr:hypothetical protein [Nitrosomonas sp.]
MDFWPRKDFYQHTDFSCHADVVPSLLAHRGCMDYAQQMLVRLKKMPSGQLPWKRSKVYDVFSLSILLRLSYGMKQAAINGGSKQKFDIKYPNPCNLVEGKWISLQCDATCSL